ncbi:hypothetical protein BJG93_35255 [Paraburkholderia sprentiae WSM5005]|uniref:Uncharacterized protein n=1 Tax=Paraburkholderia sprentiae WSM5005 TaxID=754502 RepID=A0A8F4KJN7_9BURK|nr:hypothetical protein BJG93_35255 [Paraburkholderia sprentiae WSM5005]
MPPSLRKPPARCRIRCARFEWLISGREHRGLSGCEWLSPNPDAGLCDLSDEVLLSRDEDLDGGLSANFSLDSLISLSTGNIDPHSRGALFENSASVGMRQTGLGFFRMGQQNDFAFDYF